MKKKEQEQVKIKQLQQNIFKSMGISGFYYTER